MPNTFLKAQQIAGAALGLLQREILLPQFVWLNAVGDFTGAKDDTITLRVPARADARVRQLRDNSTGLVMDQLQETKVDVTLDRDIYHGVNITDENLTLDIADFGAQVLTPQVRAVAEGVEDALANTMVNANYATTLTLDSTDAWKTVMAARNALNKAFVPMDGRVLVVGSDLEMAILNSPHLNTNSGSGESIAQGIIRDASIGRIGGFEVYVSMALPPTQGFAFHRTAYILTTRAPAIPDGAAYGATQAYNGLALRWIRDYDARFTQDRSILSTWLGTNIVADGPSSNATQNVTISGSPTGGSFTLSYLGNSTAPIAYNASAANVKTALVALQNLSANDVSVTGSAGGPYQIVFSHSDAYNTPNLVATSSLTGGTSPTVAVTPATSGTASFVRSVKITA